MATQASARSPQTMYLKITQKTLFTWRRVLTEMCARTNSQCAQHRKLVFTRCHGVNALDVHNGTESVHRCRGMPCTEAAPCDSHDLRLSGPIHADCTLRPAEALRLIS